MFIDPKGKYMSTKVEIDDHFIQFILERLLEAGETGKVAILWLGFTLATKEAHDESMDEAIQTAGLALMITMSNDEAISLLMSLELTLEGEIDGMTDLGEMVISRYVDQQLAWLSEDTNRIWALFEHAAGMQVDGMDLHKSGEYLRIELGQIDALMHQLAERDLVVKTFNDGWLATGLGLVALKRAAVSLG